MANISFLLNHFPSGGVERVVMNIVPALTYEKGHRFFIFVCKLNEEKLDGVDLPVTFIKLPYRTTDKRNKEIIAEAIKKHNIDLFISPIISPKYIYALKEENLCKVCYVLHGVPFYELKEIENSFHVKGHLKDGLGEFLKKHLLTIPKFKLGYYHRKVEKRYKQRYEQLDAFGVLNDNYKGMIAQNIGVSENDPKFFTLQNPILPVSNELSVAERKKRIIFVGRLSYTDKRVDRLLKIWEKVCMAFKEWELMIIGDGPEEKNLKQYVQKNNLPRVQFVNFTSTPEQYYRESEILCLTSDFEGCPMVLLEAQQHGCATMAFDCSFGVRDILSPNWKNGVFVPNGDIVAYAKALSKLMQDEELRRGIQKNGIENVKRFSIENSVEQYDAMIQKLCSGH